VLVHVLPPRRAVICSLVENSSTHYTHESKATPPPNPLPFSFNPFFSMIGIALIT